MLQNIVPREVSDGGSGDKRGGEWTPSCCRNTIFSMVIMNYAQCKPKDGTSSMLKLKTDFKKAGNIDLMMVWHVCHAPGCYSYILHFLPHFFATNSFQLHLFDVYISCHAHKREADNSFREKKIQMTWQFCAQVFSWAPIYPLVSSAIHCSCTADEL